MKKKILLVRSTPNDIDINAYNVQQVGLGKQFCHLGYDFDFITFKRKAPREEFIFYEVDGCRAKCIELQRIRLFRWGINLSICKKDFLDQYDLIICQEYYQLQTYLMSRKSDRVVMYSGPYYNMFLPKSLSYVFDFLLTARIDRQIKYKFVKSKLANDFLKNKGYTNLHNLGVALDTSRFDNDICIQSETQTLINFMQKNECILYVGTLCERKNFPFLLEVYINTLKHVPNLKFVIIGKSRVSALQKLYGGKDSSYAEKYFSKLPIEVRAGIFHVERIDNPQLKYIYPLAKAFLLPSKLEIFGMVLLEAMYLKTPVITSLNGGSMTLIEGRNTGIIVELFDVKLWTDAILKYINDSDYVSSVTRNANKLVSEEYSWAVLANKILKITGL